MSSLIFILFIISLVTSLQQTLEDKRQVKVLHLVVTRFQQYQPNLLHLGEARLKLFKTFCLSSMKKQSTQRFIWLILTDPLLHLSLREEIKRLLAPHENYFLIPRLGFVTTQDVLSGNMSQQEIWSGRYSSLVLLLNDNILLLITSCQF